HGVPGSRRRRPGVSGCRGAGGAGRRRRLIGLAGRLTGRALGRAGRRLLHVTAGERGDEEDESETVHGGLLHEVPVLDGGDPQTPARRILTRLPGARYRRDLARKFRALAAPTG